VDKKFPSPKRVFMRCGLVEERGVKEAQPHHQKSGCAGDPEKYRVDFLCVVDKKIAHEQDQDPRNRGEHTSLRAVALPVGEKCIIENKRQKEKKKDHKFLFGFSESFHKSENGKKVKGRIEEQSVPLIEEVVEQGVDTEKQRNFEDGLLESLDFFRCEHAFINGDGIVGSVESMNIDVEEN